MKASTLEPRRPAVTASHIVDWLRGMDSPALCDLHRTVRVSKKDLCPDHGAVHSKDVVETTDAKTFS